MEGAAPPGGLQLEELGRGEERGAAQAAAAGAHPGGRARRRAGEFVVTWSRGHVVLQGNFTPRLESEREGGGVNIIQK